ncbi:MAG: pyridoxamine 5'-phosphate oxidase [Bacteroidota bacterium]
MKIDPTIIENLREDYRAKSLDRADVLADPIDQFGRWFQEALDAQLQEANAMTLATSTATGVPSARIVLLKGFDANGFVFYTNYQSRKSQELIDNPKAALVFCWLDLQRQIRIEGSVEKQAPALSERYFQSRPKGSQIGAWASPQSQVIQDRQILEKRVEALKLEYAEVDQLPLPDNWGGFVLKPNYLEFWQGRSSRLHDRIAYTLEEGQWTIDRLAP